jgi:hypothetical protein
VAWDYLADASLGYKWVAALPTNPPYKTNAASAALPTLTGVSPAIGPATAAATSITLTGTGFTSAVLVTFAGRAVANGDWSIVSDTEIEVTLPPDAWENESALVAVRVVTATGVATLADSYTYVGTPTITSISDSARAPIAGGATRVITGTNFIGTTSVEFGGTAAPSYTIDSNTQITAVVPAHAAGDADCVVDNGYDTASSQFDYYGVPSTTSISDSARAPVAGGVSRVITGSGFWLASAVTFGGTAATSFTVDSDTQITATVPAHAAGDADCVVTGPGGSDTEQFDYYGVPSLDALARPIGNPEGGDERILTGSGFWLASAVTFGGTAATSFTVDSDTQITCTTPAKAAAQYDVVVTGPGGSDTETNGYEYWDPNVLGVTFYAEKPDYAASGTATWTAKAGTSPTAAANFPDVINGAPDFTHGNLDSLQVGSASSGLFRTYSGTGDFMYAVVGRLDSIQSTATSSVFNGDGILADVASYQGLLLGGSGQDKAYFYVWDGAEKKASITMSAGRFVILCKKESSNLYMSLDGGSTWTAAVAVAAVSPTGGATSTLYIGRGAAVSGTAKYFNGALFVAVIDNRAWSGAECTKFKAWADSQHPGTS